MPRLLSALAAAALASVASAQFTVVNGFGPMNWQGVTLVIPTGEFAMTNGTEWWFAQ